MLMPPMANSGNQLAAQQCIAQNSGAESIVCLERLYYLGTRKIAITESQVKSALRKRKANGDLSQTHYEAAMAEFKKSSSFFNQYRDRTCYFAASATDGAASGYSQVLYSCLIEENERRIDFLNGILN
jgi:uncharacterized protein YecT (DUF1311 family)